MSLSIVKKDGEVIVEGTPDAPLMRGVRDVDRVIEACFADGARRALLYAANLTAGFFDLRSGQAGEILQKLRNYQIRLAVVCPPGSVEFSQRFRELLLDEQRGTDFGVFETTEAARAWLHQS